MATDERKTPPESRDPRTTPEARDPDATTANPRDPSVNPRTRDPLNLHHDSTIGKPRTAPVNPSTSGRYLLYALVAFVVVVGIIYFAFGFGAGDDELVTGAPQVEQTDQQPLVEDQTPAAGEGVVGD
jgi:hypothetical protein